jgi:hypothetical protein
MSPEVAGDVVVSDGEYEIDVAEPEVPLIRHMIRYNPEVSWNGYSVAQGKSMDDVRNVLDDTGRRIGS